MMKPFFLLVSTAPMPDVWVKKIEVTDDLTVNIYPSECSSTPFPELQVSDAWTRTVSGNTQTFTKNSDSLTLTRQSAPSSGASGTFGLKLIDQDGDEHLINGNFLYFICFFFKNLYFFTVISL